MANPFRGVKFDSGLPCKKCGSTIRYMNDGYKRCVPCRVKLAQRENLQEKRSRLVKRQIQRQESW